MNGPCSLPRLRLRGYVGLDFCVKYGFPWRMGRMDQVEIPLHSVRSGPLLVVVKSWRFGWLPPSTYILFRRSHGFQGFRHRRVSIFLLYVVTAPNFYVCVPSERETDFFAPTTIQNNPKYSKDLRLQGTWIPCRYCNVMYLIIEHDLYISF